MFSLNLSVVEREREREREGGWVNSFNIICWWSFKIMDNFRPKEGIFDYSRTLRTYMTYSLIQ